MTRAVLLDLDDTLFDHHYAASQSLAAVRGRHAALSGVDAADFEARHSRILEALHLRVLANEIGLDAARIERFRQLFESAGVRADQALVEDAAATYRECYMRSWREVPGAMALLQALRGIARIGVVSNNLTREQHDKLRFCGFDALLDATIISEEAGVSKPDPRIFQIALERIGVQASEAVMVGDAWRTDIAGARAAGIRAVWFNPAGRPRPDPWPDVAEIRSLEPASEAVRVILGGDSRW